MNKRFDLKVSKRSYLKINMEEWSKGIKTLSHVTKHAKMGKLYEFFDLIIERYYKGYHLNYVVGNWNQDTLNKHLALADDDSCDFLNFLGDLPREDFLETAQWLDDFINSDYLKDLYRKGNMITSHLRKDGEFHYKNAYGHISLVTRYIEFTCRRISLYLKTDLTDIEL